VLRLCASDGAVTWVVQIPSPREIVARRCTGVPSRRPNASVSASQSCGNSAATWATGQWCWQSCSPPPASPSPFTPLPRTAAGATLITGARVARITVDRRGLANGAIWIDVDGNEHRTEANAVVLAGNGIGTPRILLMSDDQHPEGLTNSSGLVGKNLMTHPVCSVIGMYDEELEAWNGPAGQLIYSMEFADTDTSRGFLRGAKWALMPPLGVLHVLDHLRDHPFDARWAGKLHELARYTGRSMIWSGVIDDLPEESNAVSLDPSSADSSGLPGVKVDYRRSENTDRMVEFMNARMIEAHEAAGASRVLTAPLTESGHLLGTARMGTDPSSSVVDAYGRSHDVPNLFIVDGSVMVTGGSVNPTAAIAALSLRSATHIADTARDQQVPA